MNMRKGMSPIIWSSQQLCMHWICGYITCLEGGLSWWHNFGLNVYLNIQGLTLYNPDGWHRLAIFILILV